MPIIRVEMLKGRSKEQKQELVQKLTDGFVESCGGNKASIHVVIDEVEADNWGIGSVLVADRDNH